MSTIHTFYAVKANFSPLSSEHAYIYLIQNVLYVYQSDTIDDDKYYAVCLTFNGTNKKIVSIDKKTFDKIVNYNKGYLTNGPFFSVSSKTNSSNKKFVNAHQINGISCYKGHEYYQLYIHFKYVDGNLSLPANDEKELDTLMSTIEYAWTSHL